MPNSRAHRDAPHRFRSASVPHAGRTSAHRALLIALACAGLVLAACSSGATPARVSGTATAPRTAGTATPTPTPRQITFMAGFQPQANLPFVAVYVADAKGFFAEEGLKVDIQHSSGADEHL